jgi:hypothetical protein
LQIPAAKISPDAIGSWPILQEHYGVEKLNYILLKKQQTADYTCLESCELDLAQVPILVERFLEQVHVKNPVLDVDDLRSSATNLANNGPAGDGVSCLVVSIPHIALSPGLSPSTYHCINPFQSLL